MIPTAAPESRRGPDGDSENHCLELEEGGMGGTTADGNKSHGSVSRPSVIPSDVVGRYGGVLA